MKTLDDNKLRVRDGGQPLLTLIADLNYAYMMAAQGNYSPRCARRIARAFRLTLLPAEHEYLVFERAGGGDRVCWSRHPRGIGFAIVKS